MQEETNPPADRPVLQELREVTQNLPPADDMASDPPPADSPPSPAAIRKKKLSEALVRVRWPLLALTVASLLSLGGAGGAVALGSSDLERWALAMLAMALIVVIVVALDTALQWSDSVVFGLVREHEADVLTTVKREARRLFGHNQ